MLFYEGRGVAIMNQGVGDYFVQVLALVALRVHVLKSKMLGPNGFLHRHFRP